MDLKSLAIRASEQKTEGGREREGGADSAHSDKENKVKDRKRERERETNEAKQEGEAEREREITK